MESTVIFILFLAFLVIIYLFSKRNQYSKVEEEQDKLKNEIDDISKHFSETVIDFEDTKIRVIFNLFIKESSLKVVLLDSQFANLPKELLDEMENLQKANRLKIVVSNQQIPVERFFIEYPSKNKGCILFSTNPKIRIIARKMGVSVFEGEL